jgi:hypothetical protein
MARRNAALLLGICVVIAACADGVTDRGITGPGPEVAPTSLSAASPNASTGGRASGRFDLASPFTNILEEEYSFAALSTGDFPNAKGQMEGKITRAATFQDIHAEVDCLAISGTQAWVSGPLKRLVINGVPQPTEGRYVVWRVLDNGEGANSPPDMGSVLFVGFPQACLALLGTEAIPLTPSASANIQVSER